MRRVGSRELVIVHVRDSSVVLGEKSEDNGGRTGRKVVDVVERERSDNEDEKKRWKQNSVGQCRQNKRLYYSTQLLVAINIECYTYSELARAPETLNDAQLVQGHG